MEKKTIQRIMGILVAIALVIIILPLFFDRSDADIQEAIKTPPFPDQKQQPISEAAANATTLETEKVELAQQSMTNSEEQSNPVAEQSVAIESENEDVKKQSDEIEQPLSANSNENVTEPSIKQNSASNNKISQPKQKPVPKLTKATEAIATQSSPEPVAQAEENQTKYSVISDKMKEEQPKQASDDVVIAINKNDTDESTSVNVIPVVSKPVEVKKQNVITASAANTKEPVIHNLKKTAWVVQLGSFKDKNNARRLADKLRSAGYKAFMHEAKMTKGSSTRTNVYIGPEFKQASAVKLSVKLEQEMKLHGFITKYKPLEL